MFVALSSSQGAYEKLHKESDNECLLEGELRRARSVCSPESVDRKAEAKKASRMSNSKSHPLLSLFYGRRRQRKTTARPEFTRYLEYVKEGGLWDANSNVPVIYYK